MARVVGVVLVVALWTGGRCAAGEPLPVGELNSDATHWLTGPPFKTELQRAISASWDNVPLRDVLKRISGNHGVAILLDRRIDPGQRVNIEIRNATVLETIRRVAQHVSAGISLVNNLVYVGPSSSSHILRTLIELRTRELFDQQDALPRGRVIELSRRRTIRWNDLDRPGELMQQIADRYRLKVKPNDRIPHDLWAAATLPDANCVESLSLILTQFQQTFTWTDGAAGVLLKDIPGSVTFEKAVAVRDLTVQEALQRLNESFPELTARVERNQLMIRGTVEDFERAESLLAPRRNAKTSPNRSPEADQPPPLSRRLFTLHVEHVPVIQLMKKLESTGVGFRFDAEALAKAGIDLNHQINMDAKQAKADEFFRQMFEPLGLDFIIDGTTVSLDLK